MTGEGNPSELEKEAMAWIRRLTSGQATAEDAMSLKLWQRRSEAHAAAFLSATRLWRDLEAAGRSLPRVNVSSARLRGERPVLSRRVAIGGGLAFASAAGVYALARPPLGLWPSLTELAADYRTGTGEQRSVALSDDISMHMNTQTSIAVRSSDSAARRIELISGEASFSTALKNEQTFTVRAGSARISAQVAKFDVRYLPGEDGGPLCVSCLDGELAVEFRSEKTRVAAGQQFQFDGVGFKPLTAVDPDVASAWQRGVLIFNFTPLSNVVDEINRYRPGRIVIVNSEIAHVPVSGRFRIDRIDEILVRIEQAFGAKVRSLPGGLVLLS